MGYPRDGRGRFAHPDVLERCYDFRGDGLPVVLIDGEAAGTWALKPGKKIAFELELFDTEKPAAKLRRTLDRRLDEVRALLV